MTEDWRQCWKTPWWLFKRVVQMAEYRWGLGVDRCIDTFASRENALTDVYFDKEKDALSYTWNRGDEWHFVNPPFNMLKLVVPYATEQVREYKAKVVMLFQVRDMQCQYIRYNHHCWDKYMLYPRLGYVDPRTGIEEKSPKAPSMLWFSNIDKGVKDPTVKFTFNYMEVR